MREKRSYVVEDVFDGCDAVGDLCWVPFTADGPLGYLETFFVGKKNGPRKSNKHEKNDWSFHFCKCFFKFRYFIPSLTVSDCFGCDSVSV